MDHELRKRGIGGHVKLPTPPLLVITDRTQAHAPLEDVLADAFAAGCRWASVREKDLAANQQVALVQRLLRVARDWDSMLTLHGASTVGQPFSPKTSRRTRQQSQCGSILMRPRPVRGRFWNSGLVADKVTTRASISEDSWPNCSRPSSWN